ncbi:lysozyme inhibitor LprI family protein [Dyella sp. KRB-257]|uniref:lysozyme inhibitor LprI family protein n=1 Tax=Dyella sp. KRB-257 TaxID=3400915 RepID=UPI003C11F857
MIRKASRLRPHSPSFSPRQESGVSPDDCTRAPVRRSAGNYTDQSSAWKCLLSLVAVVMLAVAQAAWEKFARAECTFEAGEPGPDSGTGYPERWARCMQAVVQARIGQVKGISRVSTTGVGRSRKAWWHSAAPPLALLSLSKGFSRQWNSHSITTFVGDRVAKQRGESDHITSPGGALMSSQGWRSF